MLTCKRVVETLSLQAQTSTVEVPAHAPGHPQLGCGKWLTPWLRALQSLLLYFPASPGLGSTGTSQMVATATASVQDAAEKLLWSPEGKVQSLWSSVIPSTNIERLLYTRHCLYCSA